MMFRRATWQLALSYALVQLALIAALAIAVYAYVSTAFDVDVPEGDASPVTVEQAFSTLRTGLLVGFTVLVPAIPVTSYGLAALAMRPIRRSFEAQQRFVDDASHELRTPLSAAQAQIELGLLRPRPPDEYRVILGRALRSTSRLSTILDDLLMLSRTPQAVAGMMRDADALSIVDDALDQLPPGDAARVQRADRADGVITGVPSMLSRAVVNLVANALRYSDPHTLVRVEVSRRGSSIRIDVIDDGVGMSRAERRRAFERFWRADPARGADGRGLGLSIVRETVRLHRGRVELASRVGVGTRATIEIPLSR